MSGAATEAGDGGVAVRSAATADVAAPPITAPNAAAPRVIGSTSFADDSALLSEVEIGEPHLPQNRPLDSLPHLGHFMVFWVFVVRMKSDSFLSIAVFIFLRHNPRLRRPEAPQL